MTDHSHEEPIISAIRNTLTAAGCAAFLLAGTAACGTIENLSAGQKVDKAVEKLGEQHSLSFEMKLSGDSTGLEELIRDSEGGDEVPPQVADFLADAKISFAVESTKPLAESGEKDLTRTQMEISGPDGALFEYRTAGKYTYYRADFEAFGEIAGTPMPTAAELPEEAGGLKKVLEGKWVKVDMDKLEKEAAAYEEEAGEPEPQPSLDAKTQKKVLKAVRSVVAREVTFKDNGSKDGVERITAKADLADLLTGIFDKLEPLQDKFPEGAELPTAKDLKSLPDKKITVDFGVKNGALSAVTFDLAQLADKPEKGTKLPLELTFGKAGKIEIPAGATELTEDVLGPLGGSFFGKGAGDDFDDPELSEEELKELEELEGAGL